jgi:hypothetical protein
MRLGRPLALSTSALRGPRSSDESEMFTHAACLLLWREVLDGLAKPTELLGRLRPLRWSPSSGLAFFRCGDGGCVGGDDVSTVFSFMVERHGPTTGGFRLRNFRMHS